MRVGVGEMPRVGDGKLAAALARAGVPLVHGLAPDVHAADSARQSSAQCGVLGSQVIIETGSPAAGPLGDWVADLVVVADATDKNLTSIPAAEVARVLSPYRGVAVVGNPVKGQSGLTKAALEAWAGQPGGTCQVTEDASGLWAKVTMLPLDGGDDWTHYMHGPDGNLVSKDKVFGPLPLAMQWIGKPHYGGQWDAHVVCAGRVFSVMSSSMRGGGDVALQVLARNVYNGQLLWNRPIAKEFGEGASLIVATPERVYLKDGGGVLVLASETGSQLRRISVTDDPARHCIWMILSDGVLLTLTGPIQTYGKKTQSLDRADKLEGQGELNDTFVGMELRAWDEITGKPLWQFAAQRIDPSKLVAGGGRVYLYEALSHAVCLNLNNGAQVWRTAAPIAEPKGPGMGWIDGHVTVKDFILHRSGAILAGNTYLVNYMPHRHGQAFNTEDGRILWTRMKGPQGADPTKGTELAATSMFGKPLVMGGSIFTRRDWRQKTDRFALATGEPILPGTQFQFAGCGRFVGVENRLLVGMCGEIYDLARNQHLATYDSVLSKASCGMGYLVANGLLIKTQGTCSGCMEWRAMHAARSLPAAPRESPSRLLKGQPASTTSVSADTKDWTTYRGNATRCGSSQAAVPAGAVIRWVFEPDRSAALPGRLLAPDPTISPPIAVGERVWFGAPEGAVVCIDRRSGAELWRYWTAGRVFGAPTWWQGRLYVGSWDGYVYCLDAERGSLVWRFRVAPDERRIMTWGCLASAWPIHANVLVENGIAYAAAGLMPAFGGTVLCAIDASTGALRWEKRFDTIPKEGIGADPSPPAPPPPMAPAATGQMAMRDGRLWWHVGDWGVAMVDPAAGDLKPAIPLGSGSECRGQDIGLLPGAWAAYGGRQFILPPEMATQPRAASWFQCLDEQNAPTRTILRLRKAHEGGSSSYLGYELMPVWDENEVLLHGGMRFSGPMLLCRDFGAQLRAWAAQNPGPPRRNKWAPAAQNADWMPSPESSRPALPHDWITDQNGRRLHNTVFMSAILASNAVVFVGGKGVDTLGWRIYGIGRSDRSMLWDLRLPAAPVQGYMSLTRGGDVLVPLVDGRLVCIGAEQDGVRPRPPVAVGKTEPGLLVRYCNVDSGETIRTEIAQSLPIDAAKMDKPYLLRVEGILKVATPGKCAFSLNSNKTSSTLLLDGAEELRNHRWGYNRTSDISLAEGSHSLAIICPAVTEGTKVSFRWQRPGMDKPEEIAPAALAHAADD